MPRSGTRLVGGIARNGQPFHEVVEEMGVSKQATSQLVDTLVERGYVARKPDPDDRRRVRVDLTELGNDPHFADRAAGSGRDPRAVGPVAYGLRSGLFRFLPQPLGTVRIVRSRPKETS